MGKHNNAIPNQHFKKKWQFNVKTWFNQPARKLKRRLARDAKAKRVFPRPVAGALRPLVRAPTVKYNNKIRIGRGFTFEELKAAGIPVRVAPTIGIAVDHRRRNRCEESLTLNAARLKEFKERLVLFPRAGCAPKVGEAPRTDVADMPQARGPLMPPKKAGVELEMGKVTDDMKAQRVYEKLRVERMNKKRMGLRQKAAAEAAAAEEK